MFPFGSPAPSGYYPAPGTPFTPGSEASHSIFTNQPLLPGNPVRTVSMPGGAPFGSVVTDNNNNNNNSSNNNGGGGGGALGGAPNGRDGGRDAMSAPLSQLVPFLVRYSDCSSLPASLRPTPAALSACRSRLRTPHAPPDGSIALWVIVRHVIAHDGTRERENRVELTRRMAEISRELAHVLASGAGFDPALAGAALDALFGIAIENAPLDGVGVAAHGAVGAGAGAASAELSPRGRRAMYSFDHSARGGMGGGAGGGVVGGGGGSGGNGGGNGGGGGGGGNDGGGGDGDFGDDPIAPLHWLLMRTLCGSPLASARHFALCAVRRHSHVYVDPRFGPRVMAQEMHAAAQACLVDPNAATQVHIAQVATWVAAMLERGVDPDVPADAPIRTAKPAGPAPPFRGYHPVLYPSGLASLPEWGAEEETEALSLFAACLEWLWDVPRAARECWRRIEAVAPAGRILNSVPEARRLLTLYRAAWPDVYEPLVTLLHAAGAIGADFVQNAHVRPFLRHLIFECVADEKELADLRRRTVSSITEALYSWRRMGDRSLTMSRSVFLAHAVLFHPRDSNTSGNGNGGGGLTGASSFALSSSSSPSSPPPAAGLSRSNSMYGGSPPRPSTARGTRVGEEVELPLQVRLRLAMATPMERAVMCDEAVDLAAVCPARFRTRLAVVVGWFGLHLVERLGDLGGVADSELSGEAGAYFRTLARIQCAVQPYDPSATGSGFGRGGSVPTTLTSSDAADVEPLFLEGTTQGAALLASIWVGAWRAAVDLEVRKYALEAIIRFAGDEDAAPIERDVAGAVAVFLSREWTFDPIPARDLAKLVEAVIDPDKDKALRVVVTAALLKLDSSSERPAHGSTLRADAERPTTPPLAYSSTDNAGGSNTASANASAGVSANSRAAIKY